MPAVPSWAVALTYWLHLLATVTWIGSLVALSLLVKPAASRTLSALDQMAFLEAIQHRLEPAAWFSLSVLVVTGLFQMSVNIHYNGFLSVSDQWSIAILIKHILVLLMIVVSAVYTWDILPSLRRLLLLRGKADPQKLADLQRKETRLMRLSLILAALILAATAVARAS